MSEPEKTPRKAVNFAGAIGLATALIGLVGTGLAVWDGHRDKSAASVPAAESLDNVPDLLDGYMSGPAYQTALEGHILCYDWRPQDRTCQLIARSSQRSARAVRMQASQAVVLHYPLYHPADLIIAQDMEDQGKGQPSAFVLAEQTDYAITREGICTTNAEREAGAARVQIFALSPDGASVPMTASGLAAYRAALAETYRTEAVGDKQCWRYRREAGGRLTQEHFLDGVLQPDDALIFSLVEASDDITLHVPTA